MGGATTNVVAFGDIEVDTIISTDVNIYAGKNVKAKVASWGEVDVQGRNVDLEVKSALWVVLPDGWPSWMQSIWVTATPMASKSRRSAT